MHSSPEQLSYHSFRSLAELPLVYDCLFDSHQHTSLHLTRQWFQNLIDTCFEPDDKCLIATVENSSGHPLLLLMMRSPAGQNGSVYKGWHLRRGTLASLTNFQCSYFAPLTNDFEESELDAICDCLALGLASSPEKYFMIDISLMDPTHPAYGSLTRAFNAIGFCSDQYYYRGNWFEHLTSNTYAEYISSRGKSSRKAIQNYQRKQRRLERESRIAVSVFSGSDCVRQVLQAYDDVYSQSWKETDAYPNFIKKLVSMCVEQGTLRFFLVKIDGEPAAFELAIVTGTEAIMMRTAYVQKFKQTSAGSIAILAAIEHLIDVDGVRTIDFGTDDDPYKSTFVKSRRERWGVTFVRRRTFRGLLILVRLAGRRTDRRARDTIKSLISWKSVEH